MSLNVDEKVRDVMDDSDLALERGIQNLGGGEEDGSGDGSSDSEVDTLGRQVCSEIENGEIQSDSERTVMREHRIYASEGYSSSYGHQLPVEGEARTPAAGPPCGDIPVSLNTIIEDDRAFLMFRRFLKDQCITRNLNFWLACEHFRQLENREHLLEVAKAIYVKFIKSSAPQHVTILDRTKRQIKTCLDLRAPLNPYLFETAQKEIWDIMEKHELRQFLVSDSFTDCCVFTGLESQMSSLYTPSMANPTYGGCGGGSLQHSGSEDSASIASFSTDSDAGARSAVFGQLTRPFPTRNAISDTESSRRRNRQPNPGPLITKDKPVSQEEFAALVHDRLLAVQKDRDTMRRKAQDRARKQGKSYKEIMAYEWFDLPEAFKYTRSEVSVAEPRPEAVQPQEKHTLSPSLNSPMATPKSVQKHRSHISSLALREVQDALKDLEITNQVNKKRRSYGQMGSACSSVLSTTSDSGVGDTWANSGLMTPSNIDRIQAYIQRQTMISNSLPERDMQAHAAAIALMSNSPHPDALNPRVPMHDRRERHGGRHHFVHNFPGAYSSDDSSSCFTMTSQSSTSDLFIPRRIPHPRSVYSDSDDAHHYTSRHHYPRRQLTTPKRSHHPHPMHKHTPPVPPAIAEQRMTTQRQGEVLIVYHLDDFPTPFAKRVGGPEVTLGEFKENVFSRKGEYRFFFKSFCEDIGMEIMEEYSDERQILPLTQGKILGRVEKIV